ncbi:glutamine amidotransferase [Grosmannia clavigera kw1407]|uniref:Glutamine amidotransferase n=1 Tax=Grosmannia clavigera (strain kw1407 / UAMH 11150) TaxID=655863 RepID=F0XLM0_GROCL|nr:glutamine amidotransferase [Grosmannia clavigera kw1407]EFX01339.1 glutamine amidotransferase [Grosmannia clavigera kw1407]
MCRFLVYKGSDEILLSKLILDPTHSILRQSFDSRLRIDTRRGQNNADGFGIGWFTDPKLGEAPCLFRSTIPAWNCPNLERIATKTASRLVFAHVRAATGSSLSETNCHPFSHGSLMWMHNGSLGGWKYIKRRLSERLADKWYHSVVGGTDTEWAFALFLDTLERLGASPSSQPEKGFGPGLLRKAMLRTIAIINELIDQIPESTILSENVDTRSLLNFALSDGHSVICTRYVSSTTDQAASLYYSSGSQWEKRPTAGDDKDYKMERRDKGADVVLVASEPLTFERENWVNVPTNSILTIHGQTVMVHPIRDAYSTRGPAHTRSAAFVQTKGLVANEKNMLLPSRISGSFPAAVAGTDQHKPAHASSMSTSMLRARVPDATIVNRPRIPYFSSTTANNVSHHAMDSNNNSTSTSTDGLPAASVLASPARLLPSKQPAQGNIKKKRMLLSEMEHTAVMPEHVEEQPLTPTTPAEPPRNNFGDPHKIAQYFPELNTITT